MSENFEPNNNDAAFRDFVKRLLTYRGNTESETSEELQLIVGKLPSDLPVQVPILENSKIIGSKVDPDKRVTIIFDSDLTEEEVIDFYRQELVGEGWQESYSFDRGGFMDSDIFNKLFYLTSKGPGISVSTYKISDRLTEVFLYVHPKSRDLQYGYPYDSRSQKLIPDLVAPPNSYQRFQSSGGYDSRAKLKTDLDLSAVADHYIRQLERVWQKDDLGVSDPVAWSSWTFEAKDEDEEIKRWQGLLFVLKNIAASREYFLQVEIRLVSED